MCQVASALEYVEEVAKAEQSHAPKETNANKSEKGHKKVKKTKEKKQLKGQKDTPKKKGAKGGKRKKGAAEEDEAFFPPGHVTTNHVYSSAYRKAKAQHPDCTAEFAQSQAKAATKLFMRTGMVNHLCGQFRETRRGKHAH
eukprot:s419_g12.t1